MAQQTCCSAAHQGISLEIDLCANPHGSRLDHTTQPAFHRSTCIEGGDVGLVIIGDVLVPAVEDVQHFSKYLDLLALPRGPGIHDGAAPIPDTVVLDKRRRSKVAHPNAGFPGIKNDGGTG